MMIKLTNASGVKFAMQRYDIHRLEQMGELVGIQVREGNGIKTHMVLESLDQVLELIHEDQDR